jgi:hypothetical protein
LKIPAIPAKTGIHFLGIWLSFPEKRGGEESGQEIVSRSQFRVQAAG